MGEDWEARDAGWRTDLLRIAGLLWPLIMGASWIYLASRRLETTLEVVVAAVVCIVAGVLGFKFIDSKLVDILRRE